jgi:hypothetical protein
VTILILLLVFGLAIVLGVVGAIVVTIVLVVGRLRRRRGA